MNQLCSKNRLPGLAASCYVHGGKGGHKAGSTNTCFLNGMIA